MIAMHIEDWTPYCFIIRDLLYDGSWETMKKDAEGNTFLEPLIQQAQDLEKLAGESLPGSLFLPTGAVEIAHFFSHHQWEMSRLVLSKMDGLYELASAALEEENYEEARALAELLEGIKQENAYSEEIYGSLAVLKGDYAQGIQHLEKAIRLDPRFVPALSSLSLAYFNTQKYEKAIETSQHILENRPEDLLAYITIVDSYINLGLADQALETLRRMNQAIPSNVTGKIQLYRMLREHRRDAEADAVRKDILTIYPSQPHELEIFVTLLFETGNFEKAELEINDYLARNPHHTYLKILLIVPLIKKGFIQEARRIVEEFKEQKVWYYFGKKETLGSFMSESEQKGCGLL